MWRFMLVTFGFLGVAFYQLSGGSEYAPVSHSIQARAMERAVQPDPTVQMPEVALEGAAEPEVTRTNADLNTLAAVAEHSGDAPFQITLASVQPDNMPTTVPTVTVEPDLASQPAAAAIAAAVEEAVLGAEAPLSKPVFSLETYAFASEHGLLRQASGDDIRQVSGNVVNMRTGPGTEFEKVGAVSKGTQVAVLEEPGNGWIMLEVVATGETGWMADWLVTASN